MITTSKGYQYPEEMDAVTNYPAAAAATALLLEARPGVSVVTTAQRNAYAGTDLWTGRVVWNTDTGGLEEYNGTTWSGVGGASGIYGDGSDGAVTISSNTTLARDMHYTTLVVNATVTLSTANSRIFATISVTVNGTIDNSGGNGTAGVSGTQGTAGNSAASTAGKFFAGIPNVSNGSTLNLASTAWGSASGTAGSGVGEGGAGGASGTAQGGALQSASSGGSVTRPGTNLGEDSSAQVIRLNVANFLMGVLVGQQTSVSILGGGGQGAVGGLSNGTTAGNSSSGGGGQGGGIVWMATPQILGTGTISANGGNAGAPFIQGNANQAAAGSGGGGGGWIMTLTRTGGIAGTVTFSVTGGSGSNGVAGAGGVATNGVAGSAGSVYHLYN